MENMDPVNKLPKYAMPQLNLKDIQCITKINILQLYWSCIGNDILPHSMKTYVLYLCNWRLIPGVSLTREKNLPRMYVKSAVSRKEMNRWQLVNDSLFSMSSHQVSKSSCVDFSRATC